MEIAAVSTQQKKKCTQRAPFGLPAVSPFLTDLFAQAQPWPVRTAPDKDGCPERLLKETNCIDTLFLLAG